MVSAVLLTKRSRTASGPSTPSTGGHKHGSGTGSPVSGALDHLKCSLGSTLLPDSEGEWKCQSWLQKIRTEKRDPYVLAPGAKGRSVALVHQVLRKWMCSGGTRPSLSENLPSASKTTYDPESKKWTESFQDDWGGLEPDGIVGHKTLDALDKFVGGPTTDTSTCPAVPTNFEDECTCEEIEVTYSKPFKAFPKNIGGGRNMGYHFKVRAHTKTVFDAGHRIMVRWRVRGNPRKCSYRQDFTDVMYETNSKGLWTLRQGSQITRTKDGPTGDVAKDEGPHGNFQYRADGGVLMDAPTRFGLPASIFPINYGMTLWDFCINSDGTRSKELKTSWRIYGGLPKPNFMFRHGTVVPRNISAE